MTKTKYRIWVNLTGSYPDGTTRDFTTFMSRAGKWRWKPARAQDAAVSAIAKTVTKWKEISNMPISFDIHLNAWARYADGRKGNRSDGKRDVGSAGEVISYAKSKSSELLAELGSLE